MTVAAGVEGRFEDGDVGEVGLECAEIVQRALQEGVLRVGVAGEGAGEAEKQIVPLARGETLGLGIAEPG